MTDYTQTKVVERILADLGQVDPSEPVDGATLAFAQERLTQTLEELQEDGAVDWDITGEVPGARVNALLALMVGVLAPSYGITVPLDPLSGKPIAEVQGRRRLRALAQGEYVQPDWDRARNF